MPAADKAFGFDRATAERWLGMVQASVWRYFRPTVIGAEHLPSGRGLLIGCHSGVMPYDAACTLVAVHQQTGRFARSVGDALFARSALVETFLRRQGAVVGRPAVLRALLRADHLVLLFPGGARDMERSYLTHAYRVLPHRGFAPGHGGYIKLALQTGAPIIPLAIVGAEEAHVMLANVPPAARLFGAPFFPLVLFPLPLPVKLYIRFGAPIRLAGGAAAAEDQALVDRLNTMVRRRVQRLIDDTVRRREGIIFSAYREAPPAKARSHASAAAAARPPQNARVR